MYLDIEAVEYSHEQQCFIAVLDNGETVELAATNQRDAEREAMVAVDEHNDYVAHFSRIVELE